MIKVPAKFWQPKVISKYSTPILEDIDVKYLLDYGKCLYKPKLKWYKNSKRMDIILYKEIKRTMELSIDLSFDASMDKDTRNTVISIIRESRFALLRKGLKVKF